MQSLFNLSVVLVLLLSANLTLSAQEYVRFAIKNAGLAVNGGFTSFKSDVYYDKRNTTNSTFSAEIETNSVTTALAMRDNHLKTADFLDVAQYQTMKFVSTNVAGVGYNTLRVGGNLTIKNVTKSVILTVKVSEKDGKTYFNGAVTLNRSDFGIGSSYYPISEEFTLDIRAVQGQRGGGGGGGLLSKNK